MGAAKPFVAIAIMSTAMAAMPAAAQLRRSAEGKRRVDVTASAQLLYDSNAVLSDPRLSGGRSGSDVSVAPALNMDIFVPRATGDVFLNGNIGYNFYRKYTQLNREQIQLTGGFDQRVSSCVGHGEVQYGRRLSDIRNLAPQETAQSINNTEEERQYSADIGCGGTIGLRPSVGFSRDEIRNSSASRQFADSVSNTVTAQLGYALPSLGVLSVFGRIGDTSYTRRPLVNGQKDGVKIRSAGVQLERSVGVRSSLTGSVNYTSVDPKLPGAQKFRGLGFNLSAAYRGDLFGLQLTGSRTIEPSRLLFASYDVTTNVRGTLSRQFTPRLSGSLSAGYERRQFRASPAFATSPLFSSRSDKLIDYSANVQYAATQRISVSLNATHSKRTSNAQLIPYDANRVSLTTSLSF